MELFFKNKWITYTIYHYKNTKILSHLKNFQNQTFSKAINSGINSLHIRIHYIFTTHSIHYNYYTKNLLKVTKWKKILNVLNSE